MSPYDLNSIAMQWIRASNEHELEQVLALYHDEALHYSPKIKLRHPETNGYIKGKDALRVWWNDVLNRVPTLHFKPTALTSNEDRVFIEYVRQAHGEPDMPVAEVLEIKDGLIAASRVYHG